MWTPPGDTHKIGWSMNPHKRVTDLRSEIRYNGVIVLLHAIATTRPAWLEKVMHSHFSHQWVTSEWFRLDPPDVDFFKSIERCDCPASLPAELHCYTRLYAKGGGGFMLPNDYFGLWLQAFREGRGLSQQDLARRLGWGVAVVNEIERDRKDPSWYQALAIARFFGISLDAFAGPDPPPEFIPATSEPPPA